MYSFVQVTTSSVELSCSIDVYTGIKSSKEASIRSNLTLNMKTSESGSMQVPLLYFLHTSATCITLRVINSAALTKLLLWQDGLWVKENLVQHSMQEFWSPSSFQLNGLISRMHYLLWVDLIGLRLVLVWHLLLDWSWQQMELHLLWQLDALFLQQQIWQTTPLRNLLRNALFTLE